MLLLPVIIATLGVALEPGRRIVPGGDNALLESSTLRVPSGVFTGAYSRVGFHHPGPLYFYLRWPLYVLSGLNHASFYMTTAVIVAASLAASLRIVLKSGGASLLLPFLIISSAFLLSLNHGVWFSQWNPFIIIFPALLLVLSAAASSSRHPGYLPLVVITSGFCAQTHLGAAPSAAIMAFFALVSVIARGRFRGRTAVLTVIALVLLWLPVAIGEFFTGNIAATFSLMGSAGPAAGLSNLSLASWITALTPIEGFFLGSVFRTALGSPVTGLAPIILLRSILLAFSVFAVKKRNVFLYVTGVLTLILHFTTLVSVFMIRGELNQYLTVWMGVAGAVSWMVILGAFLRRLKGAFAYAAAVLCAVLFLYFTARSILTQVLPAYGPDPLDYHSSEVDALMCSLNEEYNETEGSCIGISPGTHDDWPIMAGVALQLEKRGFKVAVPDRYLFLFQPGEVSAGSPAVCPDWIIVGPGSHMEVME